MTTGHKSTEHKVKDFGQFSGGKFAVSCRESIGTGVDLCCEGPNSSKQPASFHTILEGVKYDEEAPHFSSVIHVNRKRSRAFALFQSVRQGCRLAEGQCLQSGPTWIRCLWWRSSQGFHESRWRNRFPVVLQTLSWYKRRLNGTMSKKTRLSTTCLPAFDQVLGRVLLFWDYSVELKVPSAFLECGSGRVSS